MSNDLTYLSFDSDLFGFPVYKIDNRERKEEDEKQVENLFKDHKGGKLMYYLTENIREEVNQLPLAGQKEGLWVDVGICQRMTRLFDDDFQELPVKNDKVEVKVFDGSRSWKELEELAYVCGERSRFSPAIDDNLLPSQFRTMYSTWLKNCLKGTAASVVIVAEAVSSSTPLGFCTIKYDKKSGMGYIGLISVSPTTRGMGIGSLLVGKALNLCWNEAAEEGKGKGLSLVCREDNTPAVRLYGKLGLEMKGKWGVYHFWEKYAAKEEGKFASILGKGDEEEDKKQKEKEFEEHLEKLFVGFQKNLGEKKIEVKKIGEKWEIAVVIEEEGKREAVQKALLKEVGWVGEMGEGGALGLPIWVDMTPLDVEFVGKVVVGSLEG